MQLTPVLCLLLVPAAWSRPVEDEKKAAPFDFVDSASKLSGESDKSSIFGAPTGSIDGIRPDAGKIPFTPGSTGLGELPNPSPDALASSDKLDPGKIASSFTSPGGFAKQDAFGLFTSKIEKGFSPLPFSKDPMEDKLNNNEGIANALDEKKSSKSVIDKTVEKKSTFESFETAQKNVESGQQYVSNDIGSVSDKSSDASSLDNIKESATQNVGNNDLKQKEIGSAFSGLNDKGNTNNEIYAGALSKIPTFPF